MLATLFFYLILFGIPAGFVFGIIRLRAFARRHGLSLGEMLHVIFLNLASHLPIYGIVGAVAGLAVGIYTHIDGFGGFVFFATPVALAVYMTVRNVKSCSEAEANTLNALKSALPTIDYYWVSPVGGIAVNAKESKIALVPKNGAETRTYPSSSVLDASAFKPELQQTQVFGDGIRDIEARTQVALSNLEARMKNIRETGLVLELDDLHLPSVHVQMSFTGAEQWLRLLEKLSRGELAPNAEPQKLPAA